MELVAIRRNVTVIAGLVVVSLLLLVGTASATPSSGVTGRPVARGALAEGVRTRFKVGDEGFGAGTAVANLAMIEYTVEPGGTFGWHRHGGPVWAIVSSGTLTLYSSEDPTCTPHLYPAGTAFLDPGNHTHIAYNETTEPVVVYTTFMLPQGGQARLDAPDPGVCDNHD
jgi:quercetin dioxygenase-like cupin family protein